MAKNDEMLPNGNIASINNTVCANCDNEGWVCENHPEVPWGFGEGCCGGAGAPCKCNNYSPPWNHPGHGEIRRKPMSVYD